MTWAVNQQDPNIGCFPWEEKLVFLWCNLVYLQSTYAVFHFPEHSKNQNSRRQSLCLLLQASFQTAPYPKSLSFFLRIKLQAFSLWFPCCLLTASVAFLLLLSLTHTPLHQTIPRSQDDPSSHIAQIPDRPSMLAVFWVTTPIVSAIYSIKGLNLFLHLSQMKDDHYIHQLQQGFIQPPNNTIP